MISRDARKTFNDYFREGLPETLLMNQVLGLTAGAVLIIYGNVRLPAGHIVLAGLLFANCIGAGIKLLGAAAFSLFGRALWGKTFIYALLWIPSIAAGTFLGSELAITANRAWFHITFPGLRSHYHLRLLLCNILLAAAFAIAIFAFIAIRKRLEDEIEENRRISFLQNQARLIALQSKIKPHFLFNTLNAIVGLAGSHPAATEKMVLNLSDIYRGILHNPEDGTISLGEEIDLVRKYLEIEKVRMGDRLSYSIDIAPGAESAQIPPLLIEPIVENAVIHGIGPRPSGGSVEILVRRGDGAVCVMVRDDGVGFHGVGEKSGFGLSSVKERLELIYKDKAVFSLSSPVEGGLKVEMEIPDEPQRFYR